MTFTIPNTLDTMLFIHPEISFMIHALKIVIQPPLKPMEHSILEVTGLGELYGPMSPIAFAAPKVKPCSMLHRIGTNEFAILRPLFRRTVREAFFKMLGKM